MKRFLTAILFLILPLMMIYIGCSTNSAPTNPGGPTSTPTITNTPGSPTDTPTYTKTFTATLNPSFGTPTYSLTPTLTPIVTVTETPLCGSPYHFGNNFPGASNNAISANNIFASKYSLTASGRVTKLHVYCPNTVGSNIRMALYSDNGGVPNTLISQSAEQTSVVGWNDVLIPGTSPLAAGTYWIALISDGTLGVAYDAGNSGDSQIQGTVYGPFPGTFPGGIAGTNDFSFYADYCVGAGTPTPVSTITWTNTSTFTPTFTNTLTQTPVPACGGSYSTGRNWALSSHGVFNNYGYMFCNAVTMTVGGRVTMLHYLSGAAGGSVQMALYTDNGGAPQSLITSSGSQSAVSGVNNVDVPDTGILAPGVYWVVTMPAYNTGLDFYDDSVGAPSYGGYWMNNSGTFPTASTGGADQGYLFSMWADYCVDTGSPTPVHTATWTYTPTSTWTFTPTYTQTPVPGCNGSYVVGTNWPLSAHGVFNNYGSMFCNKAHLTTGGRVTMLHFLCGAAGSNISMALYTDSGGVPGTLITSSNAQAAVSGVNDVDVPDTGDLPAGNYWVVAMPQYNFGVDFYNEYVGAPSNGYWMNNSGTFPSTSTGGTDQGYNFSLWADYCVMGASPTPIPWTATPTYTFTPTNTPSETPIPGCTPGTAGVTIAQSPTGGNNYFHSSKFTLASTRKIVGLHCYTHAAGGTFQMAIYNDSAGTPNNLLTYSGVVTAGVGWNNVPIPGTGSLAAGTYWIATICNSVDFSYNSSAPAGSGYFIFSGTVGYPFPNPASGGSLTTNSFSFYVDTCP